MREFLKSWGTLTVAVLALVQPWLVAIWRRFLRAGVVDIHETGRIEIGYSAFGATIGLHGTLRARDRDFFIRTAYLEILKERDQSQHRLDWGAFRSSRLIVGRPEEMTLELPSGFMLVTSQPHRYNIQFHDMALQDDIRPVLERLGRAWFAAVDAEVRTAVGDSADAAELAQEADRALSTTYETFQRDPQHVDTFVALDRLCYWEAGRYRLTLVVQTARPDRQYARRWSFVLSEPEVQSLRMNPLKIVQDACAQHYGQYNFAYVRYE